MVKLSRQEIEQNIELEGTDGKIIATAELEDYLKSIEAKSNEPVKKAENTKEFLELGNREGKKRKEEILHFDEKNQVAFVVLKTKNGDDIHQYYDVSSEKPKLLLSSKYGGISYKDGVFILDDNKIKRVLKLNDKKQLEQKATFKNYENVYLLEDSLYVVKYDRELSVFSANQDKAVQILTADSKYDVIYDKDEKVLGLSHYHDWSESGEECLHTTEYYRIYNDKAYYMGQHVIEKEFDYNNYDDEWYPQVTIGKYEVALESAKNRNQWTKTIRGDVVARDTELDKYTILYTGDSWRMSILEQDGNLVIKDYKQGKTLTMELQTIHGEVDGKTLSEDKMTVEEKYSKRYGTKTKYGTFYSDYGYSCGDFVDNQGNVQRFSGDIDDRRDAWGITNNALGNISCYSFSMYHGFSNDSEVYDFKNKCKREDLEQVQDLGYDYFAARKTGEKKFGIYEINDEEMNTPLLQVDKVNLSYPGNYPGNPWDSTRHIIYENNGSVYKAEMTSEGKLVPIAKTKDGQLSVSVGAKWVPIKLNDNVTVRLDDGDKIELIEHIESRKDGKKWGPGKKYITLDNKQLLKLAEKQKNIQQKETVEKVKESYRNAKEKLLLNRTEKSSNAKSNISQSILDKKLSEKLITDK